MNQDQTDRPGPFTLREAEEWLHEIALTAADERDLGYAARLVLCTLAADLQRAEVLDGPAFMKRLRGLASQVQPRHYQLGVQAFLQDLGEVLAAPAPVPLRVH